MTISFQSTLNQSEQFEQVAAIHERIFDTPWSAIALKNMFAPNSTNKASLILHDCEIIGFVIYSLVLDEAEIISIGIDPNFQKQGHARRLLAYEINLLKNLRIKKLFLEVSQHNIAARKLYESLGFVPIAKRKKYYKQADGAFADALVLSLNL